MTGRVSSLAILLLALAMAFPGAVVAQQPQEARAVAWLTAHRQSPADYVVSSFRSADVVLIGEDHAVRDNLLFIQSLIPRIYRAGVTTLGMEFGAVEDQAALDALVTAPDDDEAAARRIMFGYDTAWAYAEYMELYRAAWALNRSLPPGAAPFRVLNLSYRYNWRAAGPVPTPSRAKAIFWRRPVDRFRADLVKREIFDKHRKMLALVGTIHATTHYAQLYYDYNAPDFMRVDRRHLGNLLLAVAPGRVRSILLHQPFASATNGGARLVQPAKGAIERAVHEAGDMPAGFDLAGTPFGALADDSYYAAGDPGFTLGQVTDGYIFLAPLSRLTGCTVDPLFVTPANWSEAQARFAAEIRRRPATIAEYWQSVRQYADVPARYAKVE